VDEYHWVLYSGVWEGRKIILVQGALIELPPPCPVHNSSLGLADYLFKKIFTQGYGVRIQMPLVYGINTDPLPDLAVVVGDPRTHTTNPSTAVLVLEVNDTTLAYDTGENVSLYAAAGIADYWVIDTTNRRVLVYRDPTPDPNQPHAHTYSTTHVLLPGQSLAPMGSPTTLVAVNELLG
jgi:Uma2 family endonuclease